MTLKKVALASEIASGFAIVVTLIVLIIEMRENTNAIRAATRESFSERTQLISLSMATNPDFASVIARGTGMGDLSSISDLTPAESVQLRGFLSVLMRNAEEAYLQMREGRLQESYFDSRLQDLLLFVAAPAAGVRIYEELKLTRSFADDFTEIVDAAIAERLTELEQLRDSESPVD